MSYHSEHGMQLFARLDSITIKKEVSSKHVKSLIYKSYDGLKREKEQGYVTYHVIRRLKKIIANEFFISLDS